MAVIVKPISCVTAIPVMLLSVLAALSGCAVGPNFKRPAAPAASDYGSAPIQGETATSPATGGGNAQRLVAGLDIPAEWWTLFQSPKLDRLVGQAMKANPDVNAAQAALRQTRELYAAERASFFPT